MKIKNKNLNGILSQLLLYGIEGKQEGQPVLKERSGLLLEDVALSLKRRLQKIRKELLEFNEAFEKDQREIFDEFDKLCAAKLPEGITLDKIKAIKENTEDEKEKKYLKNWRDLREKLDVELATKEAKEGEKKSWIKEKMEELGEEEVNVTSEKASLKMIEAINTKHNYEFEFIEMIAE